MKLTLSWRGVWIVVCALPFLVGCAESNPDRPKTYPVSGTVTYNGKPVPDANLNFKHSSGSGYALAKTDASGAYQLMTFEAGDGAVPGEYKVGITKYEAVAPTGSVSEEEYVEPDENANVAPPKNLLPAKYSSPEKSGLTAQVSEKSNTVDFELTD